MGYATVAHVQALNTGRTFNAQSKPTASQVVGYLEETAAVLDGILRGQGYSLPVATTATGALRILEHYNALGAACLVERAAQTPKPSSSPGDSACAMWASAQKMLREGGLELDAATDSTQANPRYNPVASPFFFREMEF